MISQSMASGLEEVLQDPVLTMVLMILKSSHVPSIHTLECASNQIRSSIRASHFLCSYFAFEYQQSLDEVFSDIMGRKPLRILSAASECDTVGQLLRLDPKVLSQTLRECKLQQYSSAINTRLQAVTNAGVLSHEATAQRQAAGPTVEAPSCLLTSVTEVLQVPGLVVTLLVQCAKLPELHSGAMLNFAMACRYTSACAQELPVLSRYIARMIHVKAHIEYTSQAYSQHRVAPFGVSSTLLPKAHLVTGKRIRQPQHLDTGMYHPGEFHPGRIYTVSDTDWKDNSRWWSCCGSRQNSNAEAPGCVPIHLDWSSFCESMELAV